MMMRVRTGTVRACVVLVLACWGVVGAQEGERSGVEPAGKNNLLKNPGMDGGDSTPAAWVEGKTVPGVTYAWDRKAGHNAPGSLRLAKTAQRFFPPAEWFQVVPYDGKATHLAVSAFVKTENLTKAVLDVQFTSESDAWTHGWAAYIGAMNPSQPPLTHDWKRYAGVVAIPPKTKTVRVALQIYGPGTVWFDDVEGQFSQGPAKMGKAAEPARTNDPHAGLSIDAEGVFPVQDLHVGDDASRRYLLFGPKLKGKVPDGGFGLVIVLPGGDGSAEFRAFVERVYRKSVDDDFVLAEPVAPVWASDQARSLVWPTQSNPWKGMRFSTEEFVDSVIQDVGSRIKLDPRRVFVLAWSSGGPAAYAIEMRKKTPVKGVFVAMSVFWPRNLPPADHVKGRAFYLLQSPEDRLTKLEHAKKAQTTLSAAGALVHLETYGGGHGWRGDVYGNIRRGLEWLTQQATGGEGKQATGGEGKQAGQ